MPTAMQRQAAPAVRVDTGGAVSRCISNRAQAMLNVTQANRLGIGAFLEKDRRIVNRRLGVTYPPSKK